MSKNEPACASVTDVLPHAIGSAPPRPVRRFIAALGMMTGPNLIGALLSLVITPLLVRWFTPADFGEAGNALAAGSMLSGLITLRLEVLLYRVPPETLQKEARSSLVIMVAVATSCVIASFPVCMLWPGASFAKWFGNAAGAIAIALTLGVINLGTVYRITRSEFLAPGVSKIFTPLITLAVAMVAVHSGSWLGRPLLIANLVALAVSALILVAPLITRPSNMSWRIAWVRVCVHRRYSMIAVPQAIVNAAGLLNVYMLIITSCFGVAAAGHLFIANRLIGFPTSLLGTATNNLLAAEGAKAERVRLRTYALVMASVSLALYLPVIVAVTLVPQGWVPSQWESALRIAVPVSVLCMAQLALGSFGQLLAVWDRVHQLLAWDVARLVAGSVVAVAGYRAGLRFETVTWCYVAVQVTAYAALFALVVRGARQVGPLDCIS